LRVFTQHITSEIRSYLQPQCEDAPWRYAKRHTSWHMVVIKKSIITFKLPVFIELKGYITLIPHQLNPVRTCLAPESKKSSALLIPKPATWHDPQPDLPIFISSSIFYLNHIAIFFYSYAISNQNITIL
jgi:hypothetical protein